MSKKATSKEKDEIVYEVRDVVLAKIRGFPAWPAQVVDPEKVPKEVTKERPAGKKATFYCVRFFPAGDHAWVPPKDLSKLKKHEIEAYINEPHKKSGDLLSGYRIALDPSTWEREMESKREAAEEAEADEEVDELEGEEEAGDEDEPAKTKKRKRDSEGGTKSKPKSKKDKEGGETSSKKKKSSEKVDKPAKSKKNGSKSKDVVESEDEGGHTDQLGSRKKSSPPPAKKSKREKDDEGDADLENDQTAIKVKDLRHKIQRAFLGKTPPKSEDMQGLSELFTQVEQLNVEIKYLQYSKIGKVMRHISALDKEKVPRDEEFRFKERAQALVNKWHTYLKPNGTAESTKDNETAPPPSTANGNVAPSVTSDAQTVVVTSGVTEAKKPDEKIEDHQPTVGDTSIAESAIGDVTMSEVAA
ncbi:hypothetical protein ACEPAH_6922 [Sanghuangporus vaninii]